MHIDPHWAPITNRWSAVMECFLISYDNCGTLRRSLRCDRPLALYSHSTRGLVEACRGLPFCLPGCSSLRVKVETKGFHSAYQAVVLAMCMQSGNIIKPTLFWWFWWSSRVDFGHMFASFLFSNSFRNCWMLQKCIHWYQKNTLLPAWNARSHLCTHRRLAFIDDSPSHISLRYHS